jgi:hypothetical protein
LQTTGSTGNAVITAYATSITGSSTLTLGTVAGDATLVAPGGYLLAQAGLGEQLTLVNLAGGVEVGEHAVEDLDGAGHVGGHGAQRLTTLLFEEAAWNCGRFIFPF